RGYFPARLRTALVPTTRVCFIVGLLIVGLAGIYPSTLIWGGVALVGGCLLFPRSEEHTSELQSQSNLVCRLLLEKKKKTKFRINRAENGRIVPSLDSSWLN